MISKHILAAVLTSLILSSRIFAQPVDAPIMPLGELRPGQKGQVWTVFKGSTPEPFTVEVSGVVQNALGPGKNLILCELTDPRVQNMGAVAGMSGSPLYINGRIAGVLSYQIQRFETVRYAGFTPIADMLEVSALPTALIPPAIGSPIPIKSLRNGRTAAAESGFQPLAPVFSLSGISPQVASWFEPEFQALGLNAIALGGHADGVETNLPVNPELKAGDVVAAALAVGDINVAATGTVSRVVGRRVLAFGHPMLSLGATELPMTAAQVVTILPSQFNSIKVSNTGQVIGSFSQDRLSGVYGELGRVPHLVPVEVDLPERLHRKTLRFAVVRQEQVLPVIAAAGLAQAVAGSNEAGFARGFRLTTAVDFPGAAPLEFDQFYPGPEGFQQGVAEFVGNLQRCLYNPYERTFPNRIRFTVEETPEVPIGFVGVLQVSRTKTVPGSTVIATIDWHGFQQDTTSESLDIPVPVDWAGKTLEVVLAPGPVLDEMTGHPKAVAASDFRNFNEYLEALRQRRATDGLYLAVVERTRVFSDQDSLTPEMPGSLERIAQRTDANRYQRRDAVTPLWETRVLPGRVFTAQFHKPLKVTD